MEGEMEGDDYLRLEVGGVEEVMTDLGGASLCWKEGREYRHVGWLRVPDRSCTFWLYRDGGDALVAVMQSETCEECIAAVRDRAAERGYQLVDLRASSRSCCGVFAPAATEGPVTDARALRLRSICPAPRPPPPYHGGPARRVGPAGRHGRPVAVAARAANSG